MHCFRLSLQLLGLLLVQASVFVGAVICAVAHAATPTHVTDGDHRINRLQRVYLKNLEYQRAIETYELHQKILKTRFTEATPKSVRSTPYLELNSHLNSPSIKDLKLLKETVDQEKVLLSSDTSINSATPNVPTSFDIPMVQPWRKQTERIKIINVEPYEVKSGRPLKQFLMNTAQAKNYTLFIENYYFSKFLKMKRPERQNSLKSPTYFKGKIICDAAFRTKMGMRTKKIQQIKKLNFVFMTMRSTDWL